MQSASMSNDWKAVRLAEIDRHVHRTVNPLDYPDEVFEYYSIPAFQAAGKPVLERGAAILSNKLVVENQMVLFGKLNPEVLKVWLINSESEYRKIASTEFLPILAKEDADPEYLYYLCQSSLVVEEAKQLVSGSTPSRQRVESRSFYNIAVPLPPLPEQRASARVLRAVQTAREARQCEAVLERERKAALMAHLFTHGTRGEPTKQTAIGEMPENWEAVKLGDVITLQRGFDLPAQNRRPGQFPVVSSSGIFASHAEAKVAGPGVVTGRYGTIGEVFYIESAFWPLNTTLFVKEFKGNDPLFVSYFLQTINLHLLNDKTSVPGINRNAAHAIAVGLPPIVEQQDIAAVLRACDAKIAALERENALLDELFRALLEELMTGCVSAAGEMSENYG